MHDHQLYQTNYGETDRGPGRSIVRTVIFWTVLAVGAMFLLGTAFWALGLIFHLVSLLFRVALITAVVAFVWRAVTRRRGRC